MPGPSPLSLTFILIGALLGLGRELLARAALRLNAWLWKRPVEERLLRAVRLYLVLTSMVFSAAGMLGLLGVLRW